MRNFWRKNEGLTLVELIVSMAISTMIFAAAATVILLGIRIHHHTTDSIMQQYTARTVITVLENLASEGDLGKIVSAEDGSWWTYGKDAKEVLLFYSAEDQTIYSGDDNAPLLEGVITSSLAYDKQKGLLAIAIEDENNNYSSSVFCRTLRDNEPVNPFPVLDETKSRKEFVAVLQSQLGQEGIINHKAERESLGLDTCDCYVNGFEFFSEWYIGKDDYVGLPEDSEWNSGTAWCSCFVSWGLVKAGLEGPKNNPKNPKWFANVVDFHAYLQKKEAWITLEEMMKGDYPKPGDLIFFDFNIYDEIKASHVGVILSVDNTCIQTIEGNVGDPSERTVAKKTYFWDEFELNGIIGYGDPWAAQTD